MSFEIIASRRTDGVLTGNCAIDGTDHLRLAAADLLSLGIGNMATVLADKSSGRIAIRKPREGEPTFRCAWLKTRTSACINVSAPLRQLGHKRGTSKGRYVITKKEDLLILSLGTK